MPNMYTRAYEIIKKLPEAARATLSDRDEDDLMDVIAEELTKAWNEGWWKRDAQK